MIHCIETEFMDQLVNIFHETIQDDSSPSSETKQPYEQLFCHKVRPRKCYSRELVLSPGTQLAPVASGSLPQSLQLFRPLEFLSTHGKISSGYLEEIRQTSDWYCLIITAYLAYFVKCVALQGEYLPVQG